MTTRTHTRNSLSKWDKITMWAIGTFAVCLTLHLILRVNNVASGLAFTLSIIALIGLVFTFIGGAKTLGGIVTGLTSLISGAVVWFVGMTMKEYPESSYIVGVEIPAFGDPLYIIGWAILYYGAIMFIVGAIMTVVTYLRRVLKAVEGNKANVRG